MFSDTYPRTEQLPNYDSPISSPRFLKDDLPPKLNHFFFGAVFGCCTGRIGVFCPLPGGETLGGGTLTVEAGTEFFIENPLLFRAFVMLLFFFLSLKKIDMKSFLHFPDFVSARTVNRLFDYEESYHILKLIARIIERRRINHAEDQK